MIFPSHHIYSLYCFPPDPLPLSTWQLSYFMQGLEKGGRRHIVDERCPIPKWKRVLLRMLDHGRSLRKKKEHSVQIDWRYLWKPGLIRDFPFTHFTNPHSGQLKIESYHIERKKVEKILTRFLNGSHKIFRLYFSRTNYTKLRLTEHFKGCLFSSINEKFFERMNGTFHSFKL